MNKVQSAIMKRLVAGYDRKTAPTILVPKLGHTLGSGVVSRSTKGFTGVAIFFETKTLYFLYFKIEVIFEKIRVLNFNILIL